MITPSEDLVHEGLEDWLFLTGGANFVTSLYDRQKGHLPDARLLEWRRLLEERALKCASLGIRYAHVVIPDKLTIYGHKQGRRLVDPGLAPVVRLDEIMRSSPSADCWVNLVEPMRARRDEVDLYWRTDTHWTPEGCILAYNQLCERILLLPNPEPRAAPCREITARMDLGGKMDPVRWETIREFDFSGASVRRFINRVGRILENPDFGAEIHVGARARFSNPMARNNRKILIFGDSYANQRSNMLTGLCAETAQKVEFVWSTNIDWALVKATKPDILITEIAERFMTSIPDDRMNLPIVEARQALRALRRRVDGWIAARRRGVG